MKHAGVAEPAKVPASAVPHWEGHGWERTDPPAKPQPVKRYTTSSTATTEQASTSAAAALDAEPLHTTATESSVDAPSSAQPQTTKAPSGREEE